MKCQRCKQEKLIWFIGVDVFKIGETMKKTILGLNVQQFIVVSLVMVAILTTLVFITIKNYDLGHQCELAAKVDYGMENPSCYTFVGDCYCNKQECGEYSCEKGREFIFRVK